jgi:hypothetical protein
VFPSVHRLRTWPEYFEAIRLREKTFEIRWNDRGFLVGDLLQLDEWDPAAVNYTGRVIRVIVSYLMENKPEMGLQPGFCIMGFTGFQLLVVEPFRLEA